MNPAQWAEVSPELRDRFDANAPNTVRKVHEMDAEALVQQRKLEDDKAAATLRTATACQAKGRTRRPDMEATPSRLRQQLDSADREVLAAASDTKAHDGEVAAAEKAARALEASRRPQQARSPSAQPLSLIHI